MVERRYVVRVLDILEQAATVLAQGDPNRQVSLMKIYVFIFVYLRGRFASLLRFLHYRTTCVSDPILIVKTLDPDSGSRSETMITTQ